MKVEFLAALAAFAACQTPRSVPVPAAAPACPALTVDVKDRMLVSDSAGLTYRPPKTFIEEPEREELPCRRWNTDDPSPGYLWVGFNRSAQHWITLRRVPSPRMHEMTECIDWVAGREILVQAWRTEGGIFRNRRRWDRYDVFALVPIEPDLTVYLAGGGADRRFQTVVVAIARTVEVFVGR